MTLQIDGYVKPDASIAVEQGVSFEYPTKYGTITIRSGRARQHALPLGDAEPPAVAAAPQEPGRDDDEADQRFLGVVRDNLLIAWSTTIKSGGKAIEPTRENFVALLASDACSKVLSVYLQDGGDEELFWPLSDEELEGESQAELPGSSDTPPVKAGSEK